jgi:hypothetical protein
MAGYFTQFDSLDPTDPKTKKAINVFGLCLHADMSYDTFCGIENGEYDKVDPNFSKSVKKAKLKLLDFNAQHSLSHTAGAVFNTVNLTRKMAEPWKNAQHQEVSGPNGGPVQVEGFRIVLVEPEKPKA